MSSDSNLPEKHPNFLDLDISNLAEINNRIREELELNNFYRAISQNGEDVIKVLTKEGVFLFVSPSIRSISGYSEKDLLGKNILSFIHVAGSNKDNRILLIFNKQWEYRKLKLTASHVDGSKIYFESYCYFVLDIDGLELYVLICKNVTKRVLKERQLLKSKIREEKASSLFKKLNEASPNIICLWDLKNQHLLYRNHRNPLGYQSRKDSDILFSADVVHREDREKVSGFRSKIIAVPNFDPPTIEYRAINSRGEVEWLLNRTIVLEKEESGLASLILSVTTITTELRRIEQTHLENISRTAALLEYTKERIYLIDRDFNIITANEAFIEQYFNFCGHYPEIGSSIFKYSPQEDSEKWKPLYERGLRGESFQDTVEYDVEGEKLYFECTFSPIRRSDSVRELCCFVRDISSIKQSEIELQKLNFELDSFVYRASHDMMAPLKSILGLVKVLRMELDNEEKNKYLNLVDKSVLKLENFIKDLTVFSRNSKVANKCELISFHELIKECMEALAFMDNAERVSVSEKFHQLSEFRSDPGRLLVIFQNFISNAIKYQRFDTPKAEVLIDISDYENGVLIKITDNGRGIKQEYLEKIFEMFYRASEESYGSGLGLYITKQAIEKLGGKILGVDSVYGKGTTFTFYIPSFK